MKEKALSSITRKLGLEVQALVDVELHAAAVSKNAAQYNVNHLIPDFMQNRDPGPAV